MTETLDGGPTFEADLIALIPQLRAFGRTLTGDVGRGDDLAQDALAKALSYRHRFEPGTNLKGWTFMILRNLFYSNKRRDWRSVDLEPGVAESILVANEDPTAAVQLDELRRAMAMLPDDQREALILVGAAGLSYEETAAITGTVVGTVKSRVSRARDRLALIYAEAHIRRDGGSPSAAMAAIFGQVNAIQLRRCA